MHKLAAGVAAASCLLLCSCAATVTLPVVDLATSETAATQESSSMGLVLPQTDTSIPVWLAYAALQATPENAFFLPAIVLNYLGFDIDKVTLAENCLPMHIPYWEADPEVEFMGSPADELSFYCLPGVITTAVNTYLDEQGSTYSALDITDAEPARLEMYLAQGTPVLVWATRAFTEPLYNYTFTLADGSWPYSNSHCLVLTGYDEDNYYFADPMQEITEIGRDTFALRYEELGCHAVVITQ